MQMESEAFEGAKREAERAGLKLLVGVDGICLTDGTMTVQADFSKKLSRLTAANLNRELLVRAAKLKGARESQAVPRAVDATAGLGDDALLLAAAGFDVVMYERNPVIAALLSDAVRRSAAVPELADICARMHIRHEDSLPALERLARDAERAADDGPDVILLDPMFPAKRKSASAKKKLQLLQRLEQPCQDEEALLEAALGSHPRKVIVKRPAKGPHLADRAPDYSLSGKAIRFDCYVLAQ